MKTICIDQGIPVAEIYPINMKRYQKILDFQIFIHSKCMTVPWIPKISYLKYYLVPKDRYFTLQQSVAKLLHNKSSKH